MEISEEEYKSLHKRVREAEGRYKRLTDEINIFFRDSYVRITREPPHFHKEIIYVKLEADKLDGKLKGFLEHRVRTQGYPL